MQLAGLAIICWLLMRGRTRRRRKASLQVLVGGHLKHNSHATAQAPSFSGTHSLGAPPEVLRWQVELHDLGRELKAELDAKLIAVRAMTQAYDQATERLKEMIRIAQRLQVDPQSPLIQARQLAQQGWSETKISQVLGITPTEVDSLLQLPACGRTSEG